ncbi:MULTISPECIES: NAD(P)-dependent alcohol dehydrogenase [unclassified Brachybacterium]|uniref:NAD(P)-dependent alcohol dehydrogenase n=1 Tax=unclassified Brachybacterium TaxID=2623841 RepID=UPI003619713E
MRTTDGWAADGAGRLRRTTLERRDLRPGDIAVRVDYCGVCHTDLHAVHAHGHAEEQLVPGHEFTGVVTAVGPQVMDRAVGEAVAVGNIVDACLECDMCTAGQENFCREFPTLTYGGRERGDGAMTLGAYSREYVLREDFAYPLPEGLDPAAAAPLLCAGITVWEPMRALEVGPGVRVAVVGLGGLGHLAVRLARALGADVSVISRTAAKTEDARRLGAVDVVISSDEAAMAEARSRFDVLIDTVAVAHELSPYLALLALDGTLVHVGYLGPLTVETTELLIGRKRITSAGSGGRRETAAMLKFCTEHGVVADIELLPSVRVNEALERLEQGDVRYRFVLDLSDLDGE